MTSITVSDFFCGAGGASVGLSSVGFEIKVAIDYWKTALETHSINHPTTDHYLVDIQQVHPNYLPRTQVAWFSPECTNHTVAKGRKREYINLYETCCETGTYSAEEKSRATMHEVVRFTDYHRYDVVLVENVVEVKVWQFYEDWWRGMLNLGYEGRVVYTNSKFHGVPQSRDRYYAVFWKRGIKPPDLDYRPAADCPDHGQIGAVQSWKRSDRPWGRYGSRNGQYVWRCPQCGVEVKPSHVPGSKVIDWSIKGERIGSRKTPLSNKTLQRIRNGFKRFGQPVHTDFETNVVKLIVPPFLATYYGRTDSISSLDDGIPTITTASNHTLIVPEGDTMDDLIEQSTMRFLQPHELKLGMSFPNEYIILGTKKDQFKQIGNAVTPNVARWLGERVMEVLT